MTQDTSLSARLLRGESIFPGARSSERPGAPVRSPVDHCRAQLVMRDGQQFAFIRYPGGNIAVDTVTGRERHALVLGSGKRQGVYSTIGTAEGMPYWNAPGTGLLNSALAFLKADVWKQVLEHPGRVLTSEHIGQLLQRVFLRVRQGQAKVAGKELPLRASTRFVELEPDSLELWRFDLVTEQAWPCNGWEVSRLVQVRVLSQEVVGQNLSGLSVTGPPVSSLMRPPQNLVEWYAEWFRANPKSNEDEAAHALRKEFPTENLSRDAIRAVRRSVNGAPFRRGRKPGKTQADIGAADPRLR